MEVKMVCDFFVQNSEIIRNLVLSAGTPVAIILAVWRSMVAERQVKVAQKQAEIAQLGLLSARYQRAVEMLGHDRAHIRLGGMYAVAKLAHEYPGEYKAEVVELLEMYESMPGTDARTKDIEEERRQEMLKGLDY